MEEGLSAPEFEAYAALVSSSTLLQRAIADNLREQRSDLTQLQFGILAILCNAPEGVRMAELADRLIVSRSGLTYQVGLLENSGLIVRERDSADERGVVARATARGRLEWETVLPGHVALVRSAFVELMTADELATLAALLGRVTAALDGTRV